MTQTLAPNVSSWFGGELLTKDILTSNEVLQGVLVLLLELYPLVTLENHTMALVLGFFFFFWSVI